MVGAEIDRLGAGDGFSMREAACLVRRVRVRHDGHFRTWLWQWLAPGCVRKTPQVFLGRCALAAVCCVNYCLIAETSSSILISSETRTPPVFSGALKSMP